MLTKPHIGLLLVLPWYPIDFGVNRLKVKVTEVKTLSISLVSGRKLKNCLTDVNQTLHRASSGPTLIRYFFWS